MSDCSCGCSRDMHVGEIGCPCGLPDEPPCGTSSLLRLVHERERLRRRGRELADARLSLADIGFQLDRNAREIADHPTLAAASRAHDNPNGSGRGPRGVDSEARCAECGEPSKDASAFETRRAFPTRGGL